MDRIEVITEVQRRRRYTADRESGHCCRVSQTGHVILACRPKAWYICQPVVSVEV